MNKFTLLIHNKGWKVQDACDYWGIHYDTYNKRCNSVKFHNQLESMCLGLEDKGNDVIWRPVDSHNAIAVYNEVAKMMENTPTTFEVKTK